MTCRRHNRETEPIGSSHEIPRIVYQINLCRSIVSSSLPRSFSLIRVVLILGLLLLAVGGLASPAGSTFYSKLDLQYKELKDANAHHLSLDVHSPQQATSAPIIVSIHGGSWAFGDKSLISPSKLSWLIELGYVVVSTNYRLSSNKVKHPHHVTDVAAAIAWVTRNIAAYGGNPNAIYLMGHSAGAHLASLVTLDESRLINEGVDPVAIRGVVLIDSASLNMVNTMQDLKDTPSSPYHDAFGAKPETWKDASPFHHINTDRKYPPFLILVASPVLMPNADHLKTVRERKWQEVLSFALQLEKANTLVYTVNAMQYKSHRSIDRELGKKNDLPSEMVAMFLNQSEAVRSGAQSSMQMNPNTELTVNGKIWEEAKRELGDHSANVLFHYRDINDNGKLDPSELRENEIPYLDQWDLDNDGSVSREDIIKGYESLPNNEQL